jgi:hypothetical protein
MPWASKVVPAAALLALVFGWIRVSLKRPEFPNWSFPRAAMFIHTG